MGNTHRKLFTNCGIGSRIVFLGLDGAGKTVLLYKLKLGEVVTTQPTTGINTEGIDHKSRNLNLWDVGGNEKLRTTWRFYHEGTLAVIFVVDSTDRGRMSEAKNEIHTLVNTESLIHTPMLIYANKQDLSTALSKNELYDILHLSSIPSSKKVHLQLCSAYSGEGLYEGLDWILKATMYD